MHLVELSRQEHAGLKIDPGLAEASAAKQHLIPIVASEFRKAWGRSLISSKELTRFS